MCSRLLIGSLVGWQLVGSACLFLAGKAEETPRKLKDTVAVSYRLKHPDKPALQPDSQVPTLPASLCL